MELIAIGILLIANAILFYYFKRAQKLNKKIYQNPELLREYLRLHEGLQRTTGCLLEIRKMNTENMFYLEPRK